MSKNCKNCKHTADSQQYTLEDSHGIKADTLRCSKIRAFVPETRIADCFEKLILPCPFCGEEQNLKDCICFVHCMNCGADGPFKGDSIGGLKAWNKRV